MSQENYTNNRSDKRVNLGLPIQLSFGSQITLLGQLKDLSMKSAFIVIKSSIHMAMNEELEFQIKDPLKNKEDFIKGTACISRVSPGEGIAIYFTKLDDVSTANLQTLVAAGDK